MLGFIHGLPASVEWYEGLRSGAGWDAEQSWGLASAEASRVAGKAVVLGKRDAQLSAFGVYRPPSLPLPSVSKFSVLVPCISVVTALCHRGPVVREVGRAVFPCGECSRVLVFSSCFHCSLWWFLLVETWQFSSLPHLLFTFSFFIFLSHTAPGTWLPVPVTVLPCGLQSRLASLSHRSHFFNF